MSLGTISVIVFGCIFGGLLPGIFPRRVLSEYHLSDESMGVVKLGAGMFSTLATLVIGLLIASAMGNFDTMNNGLIQTAPKIILLDCLRAQQPETQTDRMGTK